MFNLCNKAGWWIHIRGWRGNDHSRSHLVDALKWLPACSSSFYSVHIYSKNHGYFIKHFLKCLGSFCVTQIIGQSQQPRVCVCIECTQIFCLLFPVQLTYFVFFLSNTGLFHLIYKTVNEFMQSKPSHLNQPHRFFFCDYEMFYFYF